MAWTSPRTWVSGELVTHTIMNTHVRDNLIELKDPPTDLQDVNEGANYTTTSTSFVDVDSAGDPDLELTITTSGGDVLITFHGTFAQSGATGVIYLDVDIDGARVGGDDGLLRIKEHGTADVDIPASFAVWVQGLSAASHTFSLQWKVLANTATLFAGAGTSNQDVHPQFAVREVS